MRNRIGIFLFGGILLPAGTASAHMHHTIDPAVALAVAQSPGTWSQASTWGGALPGGDDIVLIPAGIEFSFGTAAEIQDLLIQGDLRFDPQANSSLLVETIEVDMMGALEIGRIDAPIAPPEVAFGRIGAPSGSDLSLARP